MSASKNKTSMKTFGVKNPAIYFNCLESGS